MDNSKVSWSANMIRVIIDDIDEKRGAQSIYISDRRAAIDQLHTKLLSFVSPAQKQAMTVAKTTGKLVKEIGLAKKKGMSTQDVFMRGKEALDLDGLSKKPYADHQTSGETIKLPQTEPEAQDELDSDASEADVQRAEHRSQSRPRTRQATEEAHHQDRAGDEDEQDSDTSDATKQVGPSKGRKRTRDHQPVLDEENSQDLPPKKRVRTAGKSTETGAIVADAGSSAKVLHDATSTARNDDTDTNKARKRKRGQNDGDDLVSAQKKKRTAKPDAIVVDDTSSELSDSESSDIASQVDTRGKLAGTSSRRRNSATTTKDVGTQIYTAIVPEAPRKKTAKEIETSQTKFEEFCEIEHFFTPELFEEMRMASGIQSHFYSETTQELSKIRQLIGETIDNRLHQSGIDEDQPVSFRLLHNKPGLTSLLRTMFGSDLEEILEHDLQRQQLTYCLRLTVFLKSLVAAAVFSWTLNPKPQGDGDGSARFNSVKETLHRVSPVFADFVLELELRKYITTVLMPKIPAVAAKMAEDLQYYMQEYLVAPYVNDRVSADMWAPKNLDAIVTNTPNNQRTRHGKAHATWPVPYIEDYLREFQNGLVEVFTRALTLRCEMEAAGQAEYTFKFPQFGQPFKYGEHEVLDSKSKGTKNRHIMLALSPIVYIAEHARRTEAYEKVSLLTLATVRCRD